MAKHQRNQSVISRQSDSENNDNHWLKQFENSLQKNSVQGRDPHLFDQINSIMNTKSKYPNVQAAVDDMMNRSGLNGYLDNVKLSEHNETSSPKKTAQQKHNDKTPEVIKKKPEVLQVLNNIIDDSRGNMSIPSIVHKLQAMYSKEISDEAAWNDDRLIILIADLNLKAKANNPSNYENYNSLGKRDHSTADSDIDAANTDAFSALMPARI